MLHVVLGWINMFVALYYFFGGAFLRAGFLSKDSHWNTIWIVTKWLFVITLHAELITYLAETGEDLGPGRIFSYSWNMLMWWICRDAGDDDTHKKIKKKAKEAVRVLHGRLVVVPQTN